MSTAVARAFCGCRALMSSSAAAAAAAAAGGKRAGAAVAKRKMTTQADAAESKELRLYGILRPMPVSDALHKFVGAAHISRAGAIRLIWRYIRCKGLQSRVYRREIICDEKLKSIFAGRDKVNRREITKLLFPHFLKTN